jgi:hypothetical protein
MGDACSMESSNLQIADASWGHEPIPLTRPAATLSPDGGEGRGEGPRLMESPLFLADQHSGHEPSQLTDN